MDQKRPLLETDGNGQPTAPPLVPGGKHFARQVIKLATDICDSVYVK